jgi:hypothetical protein
VKCILPTGLIQFCNLNKKLYRHEIRINQYYQRLWYDPKTRNISVSIIYLIDQSNMIYRYDSAGHRHHDLKCLRFYYYDDPERNIYEYTIPETRIVPSPENYWELRYV